MLCREGHWSRGCAMWYTRLRVFGSRDSRTIICATQFTGSISTSQSWWEGGAVAQCQWPLTMAPFARHRGAYQVGDCTDGSARGEDVEH